MPHNTVRGLQYHAGGSDQRRPQDFQTASGSLPSRNISMQPFYTTADQPVQRNTVPRYRVHTPLNQPSSHGVRLRPVSDLRTSSLHWQSRVLMSLSADAYRGLFTFGVFNAIQSTCFDNVSISVAPAFPMWLTHPKLMYTPQNLVGQVPISVSIADSMSQVISCRVIYPCETSRS